ncbi:hypothetical protein K469DRAFT_710423 [Zopfia rhizophila CBS 207.26]|uniref:Uncharacterized protein n=1 Tax=Zopfia rhizophila CBS 207.26 TaxID=1314779 RepID=A0A6A6DXX8_9PEZI|nr:hypothetical protein K469DRAFT_710423 [Zopfia rhizophila CBS 207.26]
MEVRDPLNKEKTQITFEYDGGCHPLFTTNTQGGFIGEKCGDQKDFGCDDGKVEWKAWNAGFERFFDCYFKAV